VGSAGPLPWTTVRAGCGLMWAQLYEKQMGLDCEKTIPGSTQAQVYQGNSTPSFHQQKNQHLQDLVDVGRTITVPCIMVAGENIKPLCSGHITKQQAWPTGSLTAAILTA